jgi:hypothetical protein
LTAFDSQTASIVGGTSVNGVTSVGAISGTSNANGATITGTTLNLTVADATNGGVVSNTTQTFAGAKTFNGSITVNNNGIVMSGTSGNNTLIALNGNVQQSATNTNQYALQIQPTVDLVNVTGGTLGQYYNLINVASTTASAARTISNYFGNFTRLDNGANVTVGNSYGYYVANGSNAGTITNSYGIYVENLTRGAANIPLRVAGATGNILNVTSTGQSTFRTTTDTASAFEVQNNANTAILSVNTSAPSITLAGATTVTSNNNFTANGSVLFQNATNSASGFEVKDSGGGKILNVDTTNDRVQIGSYTAGAGGGQLEVSPNSTSRVGLRILGYSGGYTTNYVEIWSPGAAAADIYRQQSNGNIQFGGTNFATFNQTAASTASGALTVQWQGRCYGR